MPRRVGRAGYVGSMRDLGYGSARYRRTQAAMRSMEAVANPNQTAATQTSPAPFYRQRSASQYPTTEGYSHPSSSSGGYVAPASLPPPTSETPMSAPSSTSPAPITSADTSSSSSVPMDLGYGIAPPPASTPLRAATPQPSLPPPKRRKVNAHHYVFENGSAESVPLARSRQYVDAYPRSSSMGHQSLDSRAATNAALVAGGAAALGGVAWAAKKYGPRAYQNAKQYIQSMLSDVTPGDIETPMAPQAAPPGAAPPGQQVGAAGPGAAGPAPGESGTQAAPPAADPGAGGAAGGSQYPGISSAPAQSQNPSLPHPGAPGGVPRASKDKPFEAGQQPVVDQEREGKTEEEKEEMDQRPEDPQALLHRGREERELAELASSFAKNPEADLGTDAEKANIGRGEYTGYSGPYSYPERDDSTLRYLAGYKSLKGNPSTLWESHLRANGSAARRAKYWKWSSKKQKWQKMSKLQANGYMRKGKNGRDPWAGERGQMLYGTSLGDTLEGERMQRRELKQKEADNQIGQVGAMNVELSKAAKQHM